MSGLGGPAALREESLSFDMGDRREERAKREEMFAANPTCARCGKPIAEVWHAAALHYNASGRWELVHVWRCAIDVILAENRRRFGRRT